MVHWKKKEAGYKGTAAKLITQYTKGAGFWYGTCYNAGFFIYW